MAPSSEISRKLAQESKRGLLIEAPGTVTSPGSLTPGKLLKLSKLSEPIKLPKLSRLFCGTLCRVSTTSVGRSAKFSTRGKTKLEPRSFSKSTSFATPKDLKVLANSGNFSVARASDRGSGAVANRKGGTGSVSSQRPEKTSTGLATIGAGGNTVSNKPVTKSVMLEPISEREGKLGNVIGPSDG